ncbi:MAG: hypothetical protein NXI13_14005 [Proteobacteria bacterium]|nr:hypothetical protein [Pseudomonadota bacterium]
MLEDDRIARALGYPYARPEDSYLFTEGKDLPLPQDYDFEDRLPVLACGSNGSPEQLCRKYGASDKVKIPVTAARLTDIACTYSAHFSSYGSMAATLNSFPGSVSSVHIIWLTEAELTRMHETEALGMNYCFAELQEVSLECERSGPIDRIHAYVSLRGGYLLEGEPVPLAGIPCEGLSQKALDQKEIQSIVNSRIAQHMTLDDFILQNIEDAGIRRARTKILAKTARKFDPPGLKILMPEPNEDVGS